MAPSTNIRTLSSTAQQKGQQNGADENPPCDYSKFRLADDVFRQRASDPIQKPLMAFPRSARGIADFEYYTGKELNRFTDEAAWFYTKADLAVTETQTIALLGPTNLDWVISLFGLLRAGYTILALSPRLSSEAIAKLMQETRCQSLVHHKSAQLSPVIDQLKAVMTVKILHILSRKEYDNAQVTSPPFSREVDVASEEQRVAIILHSSGSTGLPKPIYVTHKKFAEPCNIGPGDRDFVTLPLFHSFAMRVCPARMFERKTWIFPNPNLPLTCESLTSAIQEAKPVTLCVVPYTLKLLREQESGIRALKSCESVIFTGSQCPDDLGDYLVDLGINLSSFIGSTECGFIGASFGRPPNDTAWNYIRPPPPLMKQIWAKPITDDTFEFVFLKDYPGRIVSNSNDPPESFHSNDIYIPHKSIPGAWKYIGRLDDRVTLVNGEKVLPLPIEGRIRQAALVKEAVVFGIGKSLPGLLLFRAEAAKDMSDEDFISKVWPVIEATNRLAEGFSQIGRDMVVPMPFGIEIPTTDKGSILRAQIYKMYEREIDNAYVSNEERSEGTTKLDLKGLEEYVLKVGQNVVGPQVQRLEDDLFTLGMDSLQAIQIRSFIIKNLDLRGNGKKLSQNVVFEQGNLRNLAKHLNDLQLRQESSREKPIALMRDLISKYSVVSNAKPRTRTSQIPGKHVIVLTGATGGLGAHLLVQLLDQPNVERVYCLLRGHEPLSRLQKSLEERHLMPTNTGKLSVLESDLSAPQLDLHDSEYHDLLRHTTHIIHCAWPVNFQLALSSFESSLQGLKNLLELSLSTPSSPPAHFLFCSSIATALGSTPRTSIPEAPISNLSQVSETGYAQSKLVGEHIVQKAVETAGVNATILRIGQVIGDTKFGIWNDTEAFPLIIRSAVTMGILPQLSSTCEWLPVDTLAECILQIGDLAPHSRQHPTNGLTNGASPSNDFSSQQSKRLVYNLISPYTFSWTTDLLPALSSSGLPFHPTSLPTWLHRLRTLSSQQPPTTTTTTTTTTTQPTTTAASNPTLNPALKLISFFEESFSDYDAAAAETGVGDQGKEIKFETSEAQKAAPALRIAPRVIESGLVRVMVGRWLERWMGGDGNGKRGRVEEVVVGGE